MPRQPLRVLEPVASDAVYPLIAVYSLLATAELAHCSREVQPSAGDGAGGEEGRELHK